MKYFLMSSGLRGCYMPDVVDTLIPIPTRRQLKQEIQYDVNLYVGNNYYGVTKKNIAWAANSLWKGYSIILPYGNRGKQKHFSLQYSPISRKQWLERNKH